MFLKTQMSNRGIEDKCSGLGHLGGRGNGSFWDRNPQNNHIPLTAVTTALNSHSKESIVVSYLQVSGVDILGQLGGQICTC